MYSVIFDCSTKSRHFRQGTKGEKVDIYSIKRMSFIKNGIGALKSGKMIHIHKSIQAHWICTV